nr:MAG TPA: hypothetical protein [Caudoviricetes sp.]
MRAFSGKRKHRRAVRRQAVCRRDDIFRIRAYQHGQQTRRYPRKRPAHAGALPVSQRSRNIAVLIEYLADPRRIFYPHAASRRSGIILRAAHILLFHCSRRKIKLSRGQCKFTYRFISFSHKFDRGFRLAKASLLLKFTEKPSVSAS